MNFYQAHVGSQSIKRIVHLCGITQSSQNGLQSLLMI